jgi:chromosome segregation ATPase
MEENSRLKEQVDRLQGESTRKDTAVTKAETSAALHANRVEQIKRQINEGSANVARLEGKNKELKQKVLNLQNERTHKEKQFQAREQRLRKSAAVLRSYEEEIFSKDTEIIAKEKLLAKMESERTELNGRVDSSSAKVKTAVA